MGRIAAPYGVKGWLKIQAFTEYLDSLLDYPVWRLGKGGEWRDHRVLEAKVHGQFLVARLDGIDDRDTAEAARGLEVSVARDQLPPAEDGEYYWNDLQGMQVVNTAGEVLGVVAGLLETGAHDVLKVTGDRERLIPFVGAIVRDVDTQGGRITVHWAADW